MDTPSPVDGLPAFSVNAKIVFDAAVAEAARRKHACVASEHVLWAVVCRECREQPRIVQWLAQECGLKPDKLARAVEKSLKARPLWKEAMAGDHPNIDPVSPLLSTALSTALRLVAQFSTGPVHDPSLGVTHSKGLVATEFLVAALLLEGTNVAADILQRLSKGSINSQSILKTLNIDPASILRPRHGEQTWETFTIGAPHTHLTPWYPHKIPDIKSFHEAPTDRSNWLVNDHLLIGAKPGGYYSDTWPDLEAYLKVGMSTFVCLIGEFSSVEAYRRSYPSQAEKHGASAEFIHFRISDFETVDREQLQPFVLELARRLRRGENVYVHCLGGHGRTGMVVIPLICTLFDLDYRKAEKFVGDATAAGRIADRGYYHEMPETDDQADVASSANPYVRKHKR